jgi:hypothetical protein
MAQDLQKQLAFVNQQRQRRQQWRRAEIICENTTRERNGYQGNRKIITETKRRTPLTVSGCLRVVAKLGPKCLTMYSTVKGARVFTLAYATGSISRPMANAKGGRGFTIQGSGVENRDKQVGKRCTDQQRHREDGYGISITALRAAKTSGRRRATRRTSDDQGSATRSARYCMAIAVRPHSLSRLHRSRCCCW